jgi:hypothetical protein
VSTFRQEIWVTLDGEVVKCQSKAIDITNAEQAFARDGGQIEKNPTMFRFRIAYTVLKRTHPEHPAAGSYGVFLDMLDEIEEEALRDADEGDPLDPTRAAGSDD